MKRLVRAGAFLRKELVAILRQPRLVITLVVGPFVILGAFGAGLSDDDPRLDFVVVAPAEGSLRTLAEDFVDDGRFYGNFVGLTDDLPAALDRLRAGGIDLVVSLPDEPLEEVREGRRAVVRVYHTRLDPVEARAVQLSTRRAGDLLNEQYARGLVVDAQEVAGDLLDRIELVREQLDRLEAEGVGGGALEQQLRAELAALVEELEAFSSVPPEVLASPFLGIAQRWGPGRIGLTEFYAPAVIVLLVQHMVLSFAGLSTVRDEQLGAMELFRVAPVTAGEILVGKFAAYLIIGVGVTLLSIALMVVGLGVPLRGGLLLLVLGAAVSVCAAVALGFLLALVAQTDSQAVQYAMLILLASIFFSGFILSLDRFVPPLDRISAVLPATYAIDFFRQLLLQGGAPVRQALLPLAGITAAATGASWVLLRRRLSP